MDRGQAQGYRGVSDPGFPHSRDGDIVQCCLAWQE